MTLGRILWRLVVAGLGFSLAVIASVVIGAFGLGAAAAGGQVVDGDASGVVALVAVVMRGGLLLPIFMTIVWPAWLAAIALGEVTGTRSLLAHLVVATVIAVVGLFGGAPVVGLVHVRAITAVGLVAGFVHWLVAGRSAGLGTAARVAGAPRPPHDGPRETEVSGD